MNLPPFLVAGTIAAVCAGCGSVAVAGLMTPGEPDGEGAPAAAFATSPPHAAPMSHPRGDRWRRAPDGLFYIEARVNGAPVRFLVDTGASVTVLTADDAARVGAATGGGERTLATVGGATAIRWARLRTVRVAGHDVHGGAPVAVLSRGGGVSLLGQDMLRRLPLSFSGDDLRIG